jgi:hypothetical protein
MKIALKILFLALISYSCTNIEKEAEMLADYCYCQTTQAKTQAEKTQAKRNCNDMKNQIEKQHGKDLSKASDEEKERFNEVFFKRINECT